mmetsp:Transcript_1142/g.4671  ORF Transcript_1142/g.4671 Transcript_1142/m.4671 type:complete len:269 (-) Transcript_1142:784-1590(-)
MMAIDLPPAARRTPAPHGARWPLNAHGSSWAPTRWDSSLAADPHPMRDLEGQLLEVLLRHLRARARGALVVRKLPNLFGEAHEAPYGRLPQPDLLRHPRDAREDVAPERARLVHGGGDVGHDLLQRPHVGPREGVHRHLEVVVHRRALLEVVGEGDRVVDCVVREADEEVPAHGVELLHQPPRLLRGGGEVLPPAGHVEGEGLQLLQEGDHLPHNGWRDILGEAGHKVGGPGQRGLEEGIEDGADGLANGRDDGGEERDDVVDGVVVV